VVTIGAPPAVSVVVATYNRASALRCALQSVVAQTIEAWELLVVGDACTDDTATVVAGLDDPRIRFVNLPVNLGEQSGPNNIGVARTTAPLIAFLNHDDLWFPDHLERAVTVLQARAADLVFSPTFTMISGGAPGRPTVVVDGLPRAGRYDPLQIDRATPASGWVVRREALERLGGWRSAGECRVEPSQDLLFRAHRMGMRLWGTGMPTVIAIPSGHRSGSYIGDQSAEQETYLDQLGDSDLRVQLFAEATATATGPRRRVSRRDVWFWAIRKLQPFGLFPRTLDYAVRRRLPPGALLRSFRHTRGLRPDAGLADGVAEMRRDAVLSACVMPADGAIDFSFGQGGARHCVVGWSCPEAWGTWNDGTSAELAIRGADDDARSWTLELWVTAHVDRCHPAQRVVTSAGGPPETHRLAGPGPHRLAIDLGPVRQRPTVVHLSMPDAWTPDSDDPRRLAIGLLSATIRESSDHTT
jgi:glycosyltransferase involved in cell wall biosynthesis